MKILIIEDDASLNRGISFVLEQEGYQTLMAKTAEEGLELLKKEGPDGILLDLNLPDGDGIECCRMIRKQSGLPVLMLTARDMEVDELMGLASGADDYMTKPFSVAVLKARLKNILDRKKKDTVLVSGDISVNPQSLRAMKGDRELLLSKQEFRLLWYFLENKNKVLLKEQILSWLWDDDRAFVEENTLSVNISRLRRKLGGSYIRTIQGMGYLWEDGQ